MEQCAAVATLLAPLADVATASVVDKSHNHHVNSTILGLHHASARVQLLLLPTEEEEDEKEEEEAALTQ